MRQLKPRAGEQGADLRWLPMSANSPNAAPRWDISAMIGISKNTSALSSMEKKSRGERYNAHHPDAEAFTTIVTQAVEVTYGAANRRSGGGNPPARIPSVPIFQKWPASGQHLYRCAQIAATSRDIIKCDLSNGASVDVQGIAATHRLIPSGVGR